MATGLEAAGDVMTGAVLGRAVEPSHGEGHAAGARCLNCGTALSGPHCHQCGQKAHVHRTLHEYAHDLLHGVFHFEGKVWRTLPMLAFRPGQLTRRYIHGERAKFVSPLAMFLFSVFLTFAIVGGLAGTMTAPEPGEVRQVRAELKGKPLSELDTERAKLEARSDALKAQIDAAKAARTDTTALRSQRRAVDDEIEGIDFARSLLIGDAASPIIDGKTGWATLDAGIAKATKNPNLLLYKLQTNAYKYSWALIPLSIPLVWLLFAWRPQFKLYDHAVFVTYSITFMMLLAVVLTLLNFIGVPKDLLEASALLIPPIHMHKQLRGAYGVSRMGGLARTAALLVFATIVLIAFLALLLAMGLLG